MNKTWIKRILIGVTVIIILRLIFFTTEKRTIYTTTSLSSESISKQIDFTALWYPVGYSKIALGSFQDIKKVYVKEGNTVTNGQVIAQLNDDAEYNQFKTAQASYYAAINNKNAAEKAAATPVPSGIPSTTSQTTITQLKGAINTAYYQMKTAEVALNKKKVKSPINGTVVAVVYEDYGLAGTSSLTGSLTGASTAAGSNYIIIADGKDLRLALTFSEQDVVQLKTGMKVTFNSRVSEKTYSGEIQYISKIPVVQLTSTTDEPSYKVIIKLDNYLNDLPYGSRLEGAVKIASKETALVVPYDAVTIENATEGSVLVLVGDKTERKTVKIGIVGEDTIEITDGLSPSDKVVIDNQKTKNVTVLRSWIKKQ